MFCSLPWTGWEEKKTKDGQVYYINHETRNNTLIRPTASTPSCDPPSARPSPTEYTRELLEESSCSILLMRIVGILGAALTFPLLP